MIIAIEGLDGVGKTTIAKKLSEQLNFKYVEKPLSNLFYIDSMKKYDELKQGINSVKSHDFNSWFYALGYIYCLKKYENEDIVCDRCLISNYAWTYTTENEYIFSSLVNNNKKPDIIFLLTLSTNKIKDRIIERGDMSKEKCKINYMSEALCNMKYLLKKYEITYYEVNRDNKDVKETIDEILNILNKINILTRY